MTSKPYSMTASEMLSMFEQSKNPFASDAGSIRWRRRPPLPITDRHWPPRLWG